jgi:hypothetical protein
VKPANEPNASPKIARELLPSLDDQPGWEARIPCERVRRSHTGEKRCCAPGSGALTDAVPATVLLPV